MPLNDREISDYTLFCYGWSQGEGMNSGKRILVQFDLFRFPTHLFHFKSMSKWETIYGKMKWTQSWKICRAWPICTFHLYKVDPFSTKGLVLFREIMQRKSVSICVSTVGRNTSYSTNSDLSSSIPSRHCNYIENLFFLCTCEYFWCCLQYGRSNVYMLWRIASEGHGNKRVQQIIKKCVLPMLIHLCT